MKKIASHGDIDIFAPGNSRFSFLKSPYAAHRTHSAVDIYYGDFGSGALSPAEGEIVDLRSYDTPTPFKGIDSKEYVIAIRHDDSVLKILHVKPDVSIGDHVSKGEIIGTFIRNGYFIFWNDPVMHVEVRKPDDYLRASNNLHLEPCIQWGRFDDDKNIELECRVRMVNERYAILTAPCGTYGDIRGFAADGGLLDGYVSSGTDGFFGIVRPGGFSHPYATLEVMSGENKIECAGIAFSLHFGEPGIKVIPRKYGDKLFSTDDEVCISMQIK